MSNSNKPAFPRSHSEMSNGEREWAQEGMTLREYAAIQLCPHLCREYGDEAGVQKAVEWADALLKALEGAQ